MKLYSQKPINATECRRLIRWLKTDNFADVARQERVTGPAVKRMVVRGINHLLDYSDQTDNTFARDFPLVWAKDNQSELLKQLGQIQQSLAQRSK